MLTRSIETSLDSPSTARDTAMPNPDPPLDPKEALTHIRTLIGVASQSDDVEIVQKLLVEMLNVVDKALPRKKRAS